MTFMHPYSAIRHLGLSAESNVVDIELKLPWDPLSVSYSSTAIFQKNDSHFTEGETVVLLFNKCLHFCKCSKIQRM